MFMGSNRNKIRTALLVSLILLITSVFSGLSPRIDTQAADLAIQSKTVAGGTSAPITTKSEAQQFVDNMTLGYNLGDTLDSCMADRFGTGRVSNKPQPGKDVDETLWGNPKVKADYFKQLKSEGINTVRIPVTWRDHIGAAPSYTIKASWMSRVEEVVKYALDQDMYVIINLHHDGGGDPKFGAWIGNAATDYDSVLAKYKAVWLQIANHFKSYDDHLIFESMNEVGFDSVTPKQDAFKILTNLNQAFVDVVRGTGSNNSTRYLYIAGYWTDIEESCSSDYKMPTDAVNHLILSVHYYTPWQFCTSYQRPGSTYYYWGSDSDIKLMEEKINNLKVTYVDKGIPVIIGEYGVGNNDKASINLFCKTLTKLTAQVGIPACLWDNGGMINRYTYHWKFAGMLESIQSGFVEGRSKYLGIAVPTMPPVTYPTATPTPTKAPTVSNEKILVKTPVLISAKSQKEKQIIIKIKKPSQPVSNYNIRLSSYSSMKNAKIYTKQGTTLIIKPSQKGVYYLQIRAQRNYKNNHYYSSWTAKKRIIVK